MGRELQRRLTRRHVLADWLVALAIAVLCAMLLYWRAPAPAVENIPGGGAFHKPESRPVYRHSVVRGGVYTRQEADLAMRRDSVVARHYRSLRLERTRAIAAPGDRLVYLSYRRGDHVFWTSQQVRVKRGEWLLTDGATELRARCGNRISDVPQLPREPAGEPGLDEFDSTEPALPGGLRRVLRSPGPAPPGSPEARNPTVFDSPWFLAAVPPGAAALHSPTGSANLDAAPMPNYWPHGTRVPEETQRRGPAPEGEVPAQEDPGSLDHDPEGEHDDPEGEPPPSPDAPLVAGLPPVLPKAGPPFISQPPRSESLVPPIRGGAQPPRAREAEGALLQPDVPISPEPLPTGNLELPEVQRPSKEENETRHDLPIPEPRPGWIVLPLTLVLVAFWRVLRRTRRG